jgi:hypothetical protein
MKQGGVHASPAERPDHGRHLDDLWSRAQANDQFGGWLFRACFIEIAGIVHRGSPDR